MFQEFAVESLPVAVIGAGPVGLAAAAHLVERGLTPVVFERGDGVGTALAAWGHVRVFSPWIYNIDSAARSLLEETDWQAPDPNAFPAGAEMVAKYLSPLAAHPAIARRLVLGAEVIAIARLGHHRMSSAGRENAPFVIRWRMRDGMVANTLARAVIDASGTWFAPNPMGIDGLPVMGEAENRDRMAYGIPDVLGRERAHYAGKRVLVVGSGHSAMNVVLDLNRLRSEVAGTEICWAMRQNRIEKLIGGGLNDQLPERGALGLAVVRLMQDRRLTVLAPFAAERIDGRADGLEVTAWVGYELRTLMFDRIVVATGFRTDTSTLRELRVMLDPIVEAPPALSSLIDPNLHSCGTVPPHGAVELAHPEQGFFIVGSKSYGRAPTFLMVTGYEQVRSVVAEIAGDHEAARQVRLVLPETGVCTATRESNNPTAVGCCRGPAPAESGACCVADAEAKAAGASGCGCRTTKTLAQDAAR